MSRRRARRRSRPWRRRSRSISPGSRNRSRVVCASLGQTNKDNASGGEKEILDAMLAISDFDKYPQLKGQTATVYAHPLSKGGASNSHYGGNAETYMNVGEAMGKSMVELLSK